MGWEQKLCVDDQVERALFFGEPGRRKFAVFHEPDPAAAALAPILVCHPNFEEKLWSHRILVNFARAAASRGHSVLRFDFSGQGDSEGEIEDFTFNDLETDVDEAVAFLQQQSPGDPVLVGLRIGGTLAGRCAARTGASAVLWEPVINPTTWVKDVLRMNLASQLITNGKVVRTRGDLIQDLEQGRTVHVEGYGLTSEFYSQFMASAGLEGNGFPGRCRALLGFSIRKRAVGNGTALERAVGRWNGSLSAEHRLVQDEPFWGPCPRYRTESVDLFRQTLDWMEGRSLEERS